MNDEISTRGPRPAVRPCCPKIRGDFGSMCGVLLAVGLLGLGACRHRAPASDGQKLASSGIDGAQPSAAGAPGATAAEASRPLLQLLADEQSGRPSDTPSAERVFDAIQKTGIPVLDPSQVLGRLLGASYCKNAHTDRGIVLSVCEFSDADTLAKGRAYSQKTFSNSLPNRALVANHKTLLTVNPPDQSPGVEQQLDRIVRLFGTL